MECTRALMNLCKTCVNSALPARRVFLKQAMADPWFSVAHADPVPVTSAVGSRLESFVGMAKLKKHALQVKSSH